MKHTLSDILLRLQDGEFHADADTELREVVKAVMDSRKAGSITIKIAVKPFSESAPATLVFTPTIDGKRPKMNKGASIFYADRDADLYSNDPAQMKMDLS